MDQLSVAVAYARAEIELKRKNWWPLIFTVAAFLAPQIYIWWTV